jgi:hypothetical protein
MPVKPAVSILLCLYLSLHASNAWSSDACSTRAIVTAADVMVSDGSTFKTESFFHSKDSAAIKHLYEQERMIVVEGPMGWTSTGGVSNRGEDFHKDFALGHQIHAFLLHFEEIVTNARRSEQIQFHGNVYPAVSGDRPYGGRAHLIQGDDGKRPIGLLFETAEAAPISMTFLDWRELDGDMLPFHVRIDDGERVFDYHYTSIDLSPKSPLWFFEAAGSPDIDEVQIYRVHRKLLAAHCLGNAALIAELSAPGLTLASRGDLVRTSNDAMRERFTSLFEQLDYTGYQDIATPIIESSPNSDLGWIWVNVRAVGSEVSTSQSFDNQWAWVMLLKKIDGKWLHVGNASNIAE